MIAGRGRDVACGVQAILPLRAMGAAGAGALRYSFANSSTRSACVPAMRSRTRTSMR